MRAAGAHTHKGGRAHTHACRHTHLSVLQGDDARVLSGADDVIVIIDPLNGPQSKTLDAVRLGGYIHARAHTHRGKVYKCRLLLVF